MNAFRSELQFCVVFTSSIRKGQRQMATRLAQQQRSVLNSPWNCAVYSMRCFWCVIGTARFVSSSANCSKIV